MDIIFKPKITKGLNSVKNKIHIMVLILCNLSDHALNLYHVLGQISQSVSKFLIRHKKCTMGNNSIKLQVE